MRALIVGVLLIGGVASGCARGTYTGAARYSADSSADSPAPVAVRRDAPTWATPVPSHVSPSPAIVSAPYAPRTTAPQPIVMSSRPDGRTAPVAMPAPASAAYDPLPPPRTRSAAEIAARLRPINATCPVMIGSPVDPSVTTSFNGRVVAFADVSSRSKWLGDPDQYARNLPGSSGVGAAGFGSASDGPVFATSSPMPFPSPMPPAAPRVSAPLAAPELPAFAMPPAPPPPATAPARPSYTPAAPPAAAPAPAPADADAGGTCAEGDCPGGNCKLPPRRK